MKSTLKIDYASNGMPIIKIIRPQEVVDLMELGDGDYDVRDKLINDFIKLPLSCSNNNLFQVYKHGQLEKDSKYTVTTIAPIEVNDQFDVFKNTILSKLIPHEHLVSIHRSQMDIHGSSKNEASEESLAKHRKITEFFDWLIQENCTSLREKAAQ